MNTDQRLKQIWQVSKEAAGASYRLPNAVCTAISNDYFGIRMAQIVEIYETNSERRPNIQLMRSIYNSGKQTNKQKPNNQQTKIAELLMAATQQHLRWLKKNFNQLHWWWGPQSEMNRRSWSRSMGRNRYLETTKPQRGYLATCNLTCVVLSARNRLAGHIPPCSTSNGTNYCLLCGVQSGIRQQNLPHRFFLLL